MIAKKVSVEYKRLSSAAHVPKRAYNGSTGYDLCSAEKKNLKPWSNNFILVDLCMAIPEGYYGRVVGHSGSAKKYGIMLHNGTIDSDY